jgi:hypothetical protein
MHVTIAWATLWPSIRYALRLLLVGLGCLVVYLLSLPVALVVLYQLKNHFNINVFLRSGWHTYANCMNQCVDATAKLAVNDVGQQMIWSLREQFPKADETLHISVTLVR